MRTFTTKSRRFIGSFLRCPRSRCGRCGRCRQPSHRPTGTSTGCRRTATSTPLLAATPQSDVGQLQLSMKNLVDLARSGDAHECRRAAVARGADAEALLVASGGG